jgi:hypothetical protein
MRAVTRWQGWQGEELPPIARRCRPLRAGERDFAVRYSPLRMRAELDDVARRHSASLLAAALTAPARSSSKMTLPHERLRLRS